MTERAYRRVNAEHSDLIDRLIECGAMPVPEVSMTNSIFRELEFASEEDAQDFDVLAYLSLISAY